MSSADAPITVGRVALTVRDPAAMTAFYRDVIGLAPLTSDAAGGVLGAGDRPLVELRTDRAAVPRSNEAGLFHTAFVLPARTDLGDWLDHAARNGVALDGASDHLVSEALYLRDPEGNGIEIYWDRPREAWLRDGDAVAMDTLRLDLARLPRGEGWRGAPTGTAIGHVHLQVGDVAAADGFFRDDLGLTLTSAMADAGWYGWGGYHHHLAGNVWRSRGAGRRSPGTTGLAEVELLVRPDATGPLAGAGTGRAGAGPAGATLSDPFGTAFRVTRTA